MVGAAPTTTVLATSDMSVETGQSVTLTANVTAMAPGGGVPSGAVTFKDGTTTISCLSGQQTLDGSGTATCTTSFATAGARSITASYAGSLSHQTSTSASVNLGVMSPPAVGLAFSSVTVDNVVVTPSCTGSARSGFNCTVLGGNNAVLAANVGFVDITGAATAYGPAPADIQWSSTGKSSGSGGTVNRGGRCDHGAIGTHSNEEGKKNPATITVTFTPPGGAT